MHVHLLFGGLFLGDGLEYGRPGARPGLVAYRSGASIEYHLGALSRGFQTGGKPAGHGYACDRPAWNPRHRTELPQPPVRSNGSTTRSCVNPGVQGQMMLAVSKPRHSEERRPSSRLTRAKKKVFLPWTASNPTGRVRFPAP